MDACGSCTNACDKTRANVVPTCDAGNCEYPCAAGFARCGAGSTSPGCDTNITNDVQNCGGCGIACPTNLPNVVTVGCNKGACEIVQCAAGYADCNGTLADGCEVNIATDVNHCGSCAISCMQQSHTSTLACQNGNCTIASCTSGFANCDMQYPNGCEVSTTDDPNNCGSCGNVCSLKGHASGTRCQSSLCKVTQCQAGWADCNGLYTDDCETNTNSVSNCGACGNVCTGKANATGYACQNATCAITACAAGFANCNGQYGDGCEVNLTNSVNNCGACGNVCGGKPNATGYACQNATCAITACAAGFANCNGQYGDGCEVNLTNSLNNCGACGNVCNLDNANSACVNSSCVISSCLPGFRNCNNLAADGCEKDILNDRFNCGACGNVCATNKVCENGVCVIPQ